MRAEVVKAEIVYKNADDVGGSLDPGWQRRRSWSRRPENGLAGPGIRAGAAAAVRVGGVASARRALDGAAVRGLGEVAASLRVARVKRPGLAPAVRGAERAAAVGAASERLAVFACGAARVRLRRPRAAHDGRCCSCCREQQQDRELHPQQRHLSGLGSSLGFAAGGRRQRQPRPGSPRAKRCAAGRRKSGDQHE